MKWWGLQPHLPVSAHDVLYYPTIMYVSDLWLQRLLLKKHMLSSYVSWPSWPQLNVMPAPRPKSALHFLLYVCVPLGIIHVSVG